MQFEGNFFKIFIHQRHMLFCTGLTKGAKRKVIDFRDNPHGNLRDIFQDFIAERIQENLVFLSNDPQGLIRHFSENFEKIEAAGGVVKNDKGELLVILRRGRWDLPKGKIDPGEDHPQAAMREVSEECGIGKLKIIKTLPFTLHIYPVKGSRWALKKTQWYEMFTDDDSPLSPQTEEDIEKALWVSSEQLPEIISNTYPSLIDLFRMAF
jgi:8-oxo-dGTP pyrophosphatase MutT (NUDIX family)